MEIPAPSILPLGESAVVIQWEQKIDRFINIGVHQYAAWLLQQNITGVLDIIPAYSSITLLIDLRAFLQANKQIAPVVFFEASIQNTLAAINARETLITNFIEIPVCYDPLLSNDLDAMSATLDISTETIINLHASGEYFVYMLGFLPGFAYMGDVDDRIAFPRKQKPVPVKKGAVAIAGRQTGIYPADSPGGWNIVGYTPLTLFDAGMQPPCLIQPGSTVSFKPIDITTYYSLNQP